MERIRYVWLLAAAMAVSACASPAGLLELPAAPMRAPRKIRVQVAEGGRTAVRSVALEDYVQAAVISEFAPASGDPLEIAGMLDVQSVISRTYAIAQLGRHERQGFDLCSTTHCQLYQPGRLRTSRWAEASRAATARTTGVVLWFGEAPANALFHADCGGHTSAADAVWGGRAQPYLAAVADDGPAAGAHVPWEYEAKGEAIRAALNADARTRVGSRLTAIDVLDRDAGGRAGRIAVRGQQERVVRAETFREIVTRALGARTIRSTRLSVRRAGASFVFEGRGFGHGVGLCQKGALARIRAGVPLESVLLHYYPGTAIVKLR